MTHYWEWVTMFASPCTICIRCNKKDTENKIIQNVKNIPDAKACIQYHAIHPIIFISCHIINLLGGRTKPICWNPIRGSLKLVLPSRVHIDVTALVSVASGLPAAHLAAALSQLRNFHYGDVIMGTIASQITGLTIVYSTAYSDVDQRKHQSSASLAFVRGIHRGTVNSPHKWPLTRKCFHLMTSSCRVAIRNKAVPYVRGAIDSNEPGYSLFRDRLTPQFF